MSVEPRTEASTFAPADAAPRPKASASGPELGRMSCTVTTVVAPVTRTNAAPTASATPSSSWSGTTPLMSYALTMLARSPTLDPPSRDQNGALPLQNAAWPEPIGPAEARNATPAGGRGGRPRHPDRPALSPAEAPWAGL